MSTDIKVHLTAIRVLVQYLSTLVFISTGKGLVANWEDESRHNSNHIRSLSSLKHHDLSGIVLLVLLKGPLEHWGELCFIELSCSGHHEWITEEAGGHWLIEGIVSNNVLIACKPL